MVKKIHVSLEQLAKKCGIVVFDGCGEEWGGPFGFKDKDSNSSYMGFATREAALRGWLEREFDSKVGKILLRDYLTF